MVTKRVDQEPIVAAMGDGPGLAELGALWRDGEVGDYRLLGRAGTSLALTEAALRVMRQALEALAEHGVVEIDPLPRDVPSYRAADLLGIPHAAFLSLLDQGLLPIAVDDGVPRVAIEDLIMYKRRRDAERRNILDEMIKESQEFETIKSGRSSFALGMVQATVRCS